jgi:hypothetical protein
METELAVLQKKYRALRDLLDEHGRRVWAATEASSLPRGGISLMAQATSVANHDPRRHPRIAAAQEKACGGGTNPQSGRGP